MTEYILQKDLPWCKAGCIAKKQFSIAHNREMYIINTSNAKGICFNVKEVEGNPDWFFKKEPAQTKQDVMFILGKKRLYTESDMRDCFNAATKWGVDNEKERNHLSYCMGTLRPNLTFKTFEDYIKQQVTEP